MGRFRLKASPGSEGTMTGTLRRREGNDFRLTSVLVGVEWELPTTTSLMARCAALLKPWQQCEVEISLTWSDTNAHPVPIWRVKRRSPSVQLVAEAVTLPLRLGES